MGNHTAIQGADQRPPVHPAAPAGKPTFEIVRATAAEPKGNPLTPEEHHRLQFCEKTIREGMGTFVAVGTALLEIRDSRLYRQTHASFGEYVRNVLALSRPRAYELIDSAQVMADLASVPDIPALPQNEAQARELRRWKTPSERAKKWKTVLKKAGDQPLTAQFIRHALTPSNAKAPLSDPALACLKHLKKLAAQSRNELTALKLIGRLEELFTGAPAASEASKNEMWLPGF